MSYIVKSSLDIGGKIVPWNEQETEKLIKEKTEMLEKKVEKEKVLQVKETEIESIEATDNIPEDAEVLEKIEIIPETESSEEVKSKKNTKKK